MTNGVIVRPLQPSDHAAWLSLWEGYLTFYNASVPAQMTALTWSRLNDPMVPLHGWMALRDGAAMGFTHAQEHLSTWSAGPYVYLEDLYVDAAARGSGTGRALINAVYEHGNKIGAAKVYWQTEFTNTTARRLYDSIADNAGFLIYQKKIDLA